MLERKVGFLQRVMGSQTGGLSVRALSDDVSSLCLVRECQELEDASMTGYTDRILRGEIVGSREMAEDIRRNDRHQLLGRCEVKSPLIAQVAVEVGWSRLWDACLSLGRQHTAGLQKLSRLMGHHGRGQHPCPLCDLEGPQLQAASVLEHMVDHHRREINLDRDCTEGVLMGRLIDLNISFLPKFRNLYVLY